MSVFRSLWSRLLGRRTPPPEPQIAAPSSPASPPREPAQGSGPASTPAASPPPQAPSPEVTRRAERAAERILSNESLTADLDDQAAQVLLDWALARVRAIAGDTGSADDVAAQADMAPRLQALERMARLVSRWAASGRDDLLAQIAAQGAVVYGAPLPAPEVAAAANASPADAIRRLRAAIEARLD